MNCWNCETELIWGSDSDSDTEGYALKTNLTCPKCDALVTVYMK